ncbi:MAG: recombination protein RecR [Gammaproteobacteria bacterium]|nr:MAG: recombination protein RecR [Gammaproteobacteria bacterium]
MSLSPLIDRLVESLSCLPGVGRKTAMRMALHLLERDRTGGAQLADALQKAMALVKRCDQCHTFTEEPVCAICRSHKRSDDLLCVVETPTDLQAIEALGTYQGKYFVLMGHLSPIEGLGPDEIGISDLVALVRNRQCREIVVATNPTMEGEATAHYIADVLEAEDVAVTRPAQGLPSGGELGYLDGATLTHAFVGRKPVK